MQATCDFMAHINGVDYALKKGETFKGDALAESQLIKLGLLKKAAERKKKTDER